MIHLYRSAICAALLSFVILGRFHEVLATNSNWARSSFTVKPGDEGVQSVKLTSSEGEILTCIYKYSAKRRASAEDEDREISNNVRRPSVQSILGRLSGICIRKTIDYWKYELCFESEIKQVHGQVNHNLGRFIGLEGPLQVYEEGTPCESRNEKKGRQAKVEFQCDKQLRIRSVEEVKTCSYLVVVGTPIVCGSADFAIAPADNDADNSATQNVDETWLMEVAQIAKNKVECSVRTLTGEVRARPERPMLTTIEFAHFELSLSLRSDSPAALAHDLHVIRGPDRNRLNIAEREYTLQTSSTSRDAKVRLESGTAFAGSLEYLQLVALILDSTTTFV